MPDPIISDTFGQGRRAIYEAPAPPPPPPARGRRFLLVGLPLIAVFAAFGSIMWLAYVDATPGSASRQPPLIRAEAAPLKVDPDDPGGRAVADQGELRGLIGDEELSREPERLLPPPEEPVRPPEATPAPPAGDGAPAGQDERRLAEAAPSGPSGTGAAPGLGVAPPRDTEASAPPRDTAAEAAAALDALLAEVTEHEDRPQDLGAQPDMQPRELAPPASAPPTASASPPAAASPPAEASPPATAQDAPATAGRDGVAAQETPVPPAVPPAAAPERQALAALGADQTVGQEIAPEPEPTPTPEPAAVPSTDLRVIPAPGETRVAATDATYRIQLAAVRNEADARRAWGLFQNSLGDVVGGLDPIIERADTANGTFYRVQVGPFANLAAAESLCEQLKQRNASCFVIRR